MALLVIGAVLGVFYGADRVRAWQQKRNFEARRKSATEPITANDPTGRLII